MYNDVFNNRPSGDFERRSFERTRFGKLLRKQIEVHLESNQKKFVSLVQEVYKHSGKKYDGKGCTLHHSNLNEIVNGHQKRNFGNPDQPLNLLWVTVTLMIYGVLKTPWMLENWVYEECLLEHCSNKGKKWLFEEAPLVVLEMGCDWGMAKITTETDVPAVTSELTERQTQPLLLTPITPIPDTAVEQDTGTLLENDLQPQQEDKKQNSPLWDVTKWWTS